MDIIKSWSDWNPKIDFEVRGWVKNNLWRLIQLISVDSDLTIEEKEELLVDYFSRYPDQIPKLNLQFPQGDGESMIPRVQNIGGTIKYR